MCDSAGCKYSSEGRTPELVPWLRVVYSTRKGGALRLFFFSIYFFETCLSFFPFFFLMTYFFILEGFNDCAINALYCRLKSHLIA